MDQTGERQGRRFFLRLHKAVRHAAAVFREQGNKTCHFLGSSVVSISVDASEEIQLTFDPGACVADATGLEHIFRLQYPRLVALLARITRDRGHAEELASEVFCRLSARPALLRPESNVAAWLYRTAVNLGLDALRVEARRRRKEQAAGAEVVRSSGGGGPLADMLRAEQRARVQAVLEALKPVSARLLLLRHAGLSYAELAAALALNPASIGALLARAASEFEKKYRQLHGGEL
jgi:RNA polymerase sigma-70 factor, ECF subfamily